ncbi:Flp family type IVb pilin [bacterium]|nr:Flp family type IVb pilin [bacterium]MBU1614847.1 Flp family type IVb pilin [bacterium]
MLKRLFRNEKGQGMVEYGLIIGLIAIIVLAVFIALGPQIKNIFNKTVSNEAITNAQSEVNASMQ